MFWFIEIFRETYLLMQISRYGWKNFLLRLEVFIYRKYWQPQLDDELYYQHELDNPFDFFAIRICIKTQVLPMKISRTTKFLLDWGAIAFIKLYSTIYCAYPLVQGWESPCRVEIQMPPTWKNREIIDLYKSMIDLSYDSRENDFLVGSLLSTILAACSSSSSKEKKIGKENPHHEKSDIRSFIHVTSIVSSTSGRDDTDM